MGSHPTPERQGRVTKKAGVSPHRPGYSIEGWNPNLFLVNVDIPRLQRPTRRIVVVDTDCERIAQVIVNLVSNAVKYSPEGSPVEVRVGTHEAMAHIEVQDHGKGIRKEQQEHIFDTFYRTPDAQASSKFGLGLGLSICKDIVERHGGRIWCESAPGKGSTFLVDLPLQ